MPNHPLRWVSSNYRPILWTVVAVAALARVAAAARYQDFDPATANLWEYGEIARNYLAHGSLVRIGMDSDGDQFVYPTAFMPPGHIFVWMGLFKLLGVAPAALVAMTALNVTCGVACVALTARIAKRLFDSVLVGLGAGAIAAVHPVFVFSVATYHTVNQSLVLLLLLLDLCTLPSRPSIGRSTAAGLLLGLATLERTEYLVLGCAVVFGRALFVSPKRWRALLITLVVGAATVLPWTTRNYVVLDRFIPVANSTGYNLFKGFNPEANGSGDWVDSHSVADKLIGSELAQVPESRYYENQQDDIYKQAATDFIAANPLQAFILLPAKKMLLFWGFDVHDPLTHRVAYQAALWPPTFLAILGLVMALRAGCLRSPAHRVVLMLFLAQTLVVCTYAVHARYRLTVEPLLFAYAAYGLLTCLRAGRTSPPSQNHP